MKRIQIRATDELIAKLDRLCAAYGLDRSAIIRMLITRADQQNGSPPRTPVAADGGGGTTTPPYGDH